jgi:RimJ/RimL family protein N-acetyltransferase
MRSKTQAAPLPKRDVSLDCDKFLIRTLKDDDASDRWASWMSDPGNLRLLNSAPKAMTRDDIAKYISQFDQRAHLLLGIFERLSGQHIGFFRVDIDPALKRCLGFMIIGDQRYRHWSVTEALRVPFQDFIFETLDLDLMLGTALASNIPMIRYLLKSGWSLDKTAERHVKSQIDGTMLDLCYMSISRAAWRAWKQKNLR